MLYSYHKGEKNVKKEIVREITEDGVVKKKKPFLTCMSDKVFRNVIKTNAGRKVIKEIFKMITGIEMNMNPWNDEIKVSSKKMKGKRVDFISGNKKTVLNLEINNYGEADLIRNIIYMFSLLINNLIVGASYKIKKIFYQINFSYKGKLKKIMSEYGVCELTEGIVIFPMLKIIEFDMAKIRKICYDNDIRRIDKLYRYIGMFIADEKLLKKLSEGDELLMAFKKEVEDFNKRRVIITDEEDERMYINAIREYAEEAGEKRGQKIGKKAGILQTAKNMLEMNLDIDVISKATGLTISQINNIS